MVFKNRHLCPFTCCDKFNYRVTNIPGASPKTSTLAITDATLYYALELADKGLKAFEQKELLKGLNICYGKVTNKAVAEAHNLPYTDPEELIPL